MNTDPGAYGKRGPAPSQAAVTLPKTVFREVPVPFFHGPLALPKQILDSFQPRLNGGLVGAAAGDQLAGVQNAPGWGLRPRTDLACLYSDQGRMQQAYDMLAPAYSWFTEGLDTEDLVDAKAVLQSLELSDAALQKD